MDDEMNVGNAPQAEGEGMDDTASRPPARFTVRLAGRTEEGGCLVDVLDGGEVCGRFERNYWSAGPETFAPFMVCDRWFALYSPDYTATRVMSLPDCRDLGGEEPDACGFCPVELWVPAYRTLTRTMEVRRMTGDGEASVLREERFEQPLFAGDPRLAEAESRIAAEAAHPGRRIPGESTWHAELSPWRWCGFGFVAGCIWGDDHWWKVEFLDLSGAAGGTLRREARFGYAEMLPGADLRDTVDLGHWRPGRPWIRVKAAVSHDLSRPFGESGA